MNSHVKAKERRLRWRYTISDWAWLSEQPAFKVAMDRHPENYCDAVATKLLKLRQEQQQGTLL